MYDIINQCLSFEQITAVGEQGITTLKPTHLLLTQTHYEIMMKSLGINPQSLSSPMNLYGLKLIFTDVPIESPRVLRL